MWGLPYERRLEMAAGLAVGIWYVARERGAVMARRCAITGKGVQSGNNVSHANNKTRRRYLPNLQVASFPSDLLGRSVRLRLSTNAIRTIEHNGGIDAYLLGMRAAGADAEILRLKKQVEKAAAEKAAA
jgi:large subunit ribosomal protein L28